MSGAASISGLASGIDTASIINQLMQLEAVPQTRLRSRVGSEQLAVNAMQTLNAKLAGLATRAADLLKPAAWTPVTPTSSNAKVSVSTTAGAAPTSFTLRVDQTARTHRFEFATETGLDTPASVPTTVKLDRLDGTTPLDLTTDGTLRGLVEAINDPANETGLRATAVQVSDGQYRVMVESDATGAAADFALTDTAGGDILGGAPPLAGLDAQITLGDSIVVTSTTNTFAELVPGVTVTLAADATGASDITLTRDTNSIVAGVQGLVDALNAVLTEIDSLTAYNPTTKATGLLAGDTGVRSLRAAVFDTVFPADGTSLASLGIETDRSGKLVLDKAAFTAAYTADPAGVQQRLTTSETGFVAALRDVTTTASDKVTGTLTAAITGRTSSIRALNDNIAAWDQRLELKRTALTRQFTALETALSRMNNQSSWLAGQISSLPTAGSGR